jgi:hypothetical protein
VLPAPSVNVSAVITRIGPARPVAITLGGDAINAPFNVSEPSSVE